MLIFEVRIIFGPVIYDDNLVDNSIAVKVLRNL
jgi:hypothetical protein